MVISGVALLLASRLLLEAQSRLAHEGKRQVEPLGQVAAEQLQADLRMATGVGPSLLPGWNHQELVLRGHPAGRVTYLRDGTRLVRRLQAEDRQVLDQVSIFRWRPVADGTVEVEFAFRRAGRLRSLTAGGAWTGEMIDQERRRLRVLPRGGDGGTEP